MRVNQKFWGPLGMAVSMGAYMLQNKTPGIQKNQVPKTYKSDTMDSPITPPKKPHIIKITPPPKT